MQRHYDIYMEKYRNLDYLEHESQKHRKNEEERKEEQERRLKKMRERLLKEEVELLRGGRGGDGDGDDDTGRVAKNGVSNSRNSGYVHSVVFCCIMQFIIFAATSHTCLCECHAISLSATLLR